MRVERCHRRLLKPRANRTRESSSAPPRTIGALSGAANQFAAHTFTLTHTRTPCRQHNTCDRAMHCSLHCTAFAFVFACARCASRRSVRAFQFNSFHSIPFLCISLQCLSSLLFSAILLFWRRVYSIRPPPLPPANTVHNALYTLECMPLALLLYSPPLDRLFPTRMYWTVQYSAVQYRLKAARAVMKLRRARLVQTSSLQFSSAYKRLVSRRPPVQRRALRFSSAHMCSAASGAPVPTQRSA